MQGSPSSSPPPFPIRACFAFCPELSGGDESKAHENILFYEEARPPPVPSREQTNARTNEVGFCTAAVYLAERFGLQGGTQQTIIRGREVLCLWSPLPGLWVGLAAAKALEADATALHMMLCRAHEVFCLRHSTAAAAALHTAECPPPIRDGARAFYRRLLDFLNRCSFASAAPTTQDQKESQERLFPYPARSWYLAAAADSLLGCACYRYGGRNDTPRLALRSEAVVAWALAGRLGWLLAPRGPTHFALYDSAQLRVLAATLPAHCCAAVKLHWLLNGWPADGSPARLYLRLDPAAPPEGSGDPFDLVLTHMSAATVLVLLRPAGASDRDDGGEAPGDWSAPDATATAITRAAEVLACAAAIAADVAAVLAPCLPLDSLQALPVVLLSRQGRGPSEVAVEVEVPTGRETFWMLWGREEGLQGCALAQLAPGTAATVARVMRDLALAGNTDGNNDDKDDNGTTTASVVVRAVVELVGDAGLLYAAQRRGDGAVLAVLVTGVPCLPSRVAYVDAVRAALEF